MRWPEDATAAARLWLARGRRHAGPRLGPLDRAALVAFLRARYGPERAARALAIVLGARRGPLR